MAAPQGDYPHQEGYGQPAPPIPGYGSPSSPTEPTAPGSASHSHAGGKKKRAYAGEAFEFGSGANAALLGQQQGSGGYGGYADESQGVGYPATTFNAEAPVGFSQQQPQAQSQPPVVGATVGGYQPFTPSYPPQNAGGMAQMTQQFGQMGMSDQRQMPQQPAQVARTIPLNQLYPTDLLAQPFNVAELDFPPPPIILPPNVGASSFVKFTVSEMLTRPRLVFILRLTRIALLNMYDPRSMLSRRHTLFSRNPSYRLLLSSSLIQRCTMPKMLSPSFLTKSFRGADAVVRISILSFPFSTRVTAGDVTCVT